MNSGVQIQSKGLECLRPILKEWIALNTRIGKEWAAVGDAPWCHIERALVSLLAGAIWRCRGDAFEEYSEKKPGKNRSQKERIDLWFSISGEDFKVEAKQCWVRCHPRIKALNTVNNAMKNACRDAETLDPDGMRLLAIVFGAILIPQKQGSALRKSINRSIKLAGQKQINADAHAWVFPELNPPPTSPDGYVVPGIIMWIREVEGMTSSVSQRRCSASPIHERFVWRDSDIELVSVRKHKKT